MERKIGEIFEYNGEWYQCVEDTTDDNCNNCCFQKSCNYFVGDCSSTIRSDGKTAAFKKLEKVGEPYKALNRLFQAYKVFTAIADVGNYDVAMIPHYKTIDIEIKQTKEDMEEKNLKPFDLQKAREGKPVCTRDGRKARIICFDKKKDIYPLIALVTDADGYEIITHHKADGVHPTIPNNDLMMLPERKEGWVNIVRGSDGSPHMGRGIFQSKEKAENTIKAFSDNLIDTVKICWEE